MSNADEIRTMFARVHDTNTKRKQLRELLDLNRFKDATTLADALGEPIPTGVVVRFDRVRASNA